MEKKEVEREVEREREVKREREPLYLFVSLLSWPLSSFPLCVRVYMWLKRKQHTHSPPLLLLSVCVCACVHGRLGHRGVCLRLIVGEHASFKVKNSDGKLPMDLARENGLLTDRQAHRHGHAHRHRQKAQTQTQTHTDTDTDTDAHTDTDTFLGYHSNSINSSIMTWAHIKHFHHCRAC